jgi:tetratricopeptide (TPR) repeat protein
MIGMPPGVTPYKFLPPPGAGPKFDPHGPPRDLEAGLQRDPGHTPPPDLREGHEKGKHRRGEGGGEDDRRDRREPLIQLPDFEKDLRGPEPKILQDGRTELTARNFGIAVELFTAAIKLSPADFHAYYYRGAAYLGGGSPKEAQADYEKVVALKPDYAQGWYQLGVAQERQRHFKEALDNYSQAATLKPDLSDAFYASAMIYDQRQAPKKALAELDKAIAGNPKYIRGYQARSEIKKKIGDPTAADDQQKAKALSAERKAAAPAAESK